jgi:O-antigen ligase
LKNRELLVGFIAIAFVFILTSPIGRRFMQPDVSNGDGRLDVWRVGVASLHQYWLGGAGLGNFNQAFQQYFLSVPHAPIGWDRVAHSILVGTAVELGIPGFIIMMALWYAQFRDLAKVPAAAGWADLCLGLRAGVLGLFVNGFSLSLMWLKYPWLAFILIAVMRTGLTGHERK